MAAGAGQDHIWPARSLPACGRGEVPFVFSFGVPAGHGWDLQHTKAKQILRIRSGERSRRPQHRAGKRSCLCREMVGEEGEREGAARLASGPASSHFGASERLQRV